MVLDISINQGRADALAENLISYNQSHSPQWSVNHDGSLQASPMHVFALDPQGAVVGGLTGTAHYVRSWLHISVIWVDESCRRAGIGRALMEQAEQEALARGCRYARLATSQYQSPAFYAKLGYVLYGKLENCPPGDTVYYYCKQLIAQE